MWSGDTRVKLEDEGEGEVEGEEGSEVLLWSDAGNGSEVLIAVSSLNALVTVLSAEGMCTVREGKWVSCESLSLSLWVEGPSLTER